MKTFDIEEFKRVNALTNKDIADYLDVSPSYISMVANGQSSFADSKLTKLLEHPTWNVEMVPKPEIQTSPFALFLNKNLISRKQIAEYMGVSVPFVSQIIKGQRLLPSDKLRLIMEHPTWDTAPLLHRAQNAKPTYPYPCNLTPTEKPILDANGRVVLPIPKPEDIENVETVEAVPIVPTEVVRKPEVRLSKWIDRCSDEVERLRVSDIVRNATMVREVKEKDMWPSLRIGQYIYLEIVPRETPIKDGKIYFVDHKHLGGFFRRVADLGAQIECKSDNPKYGPLIFDKSEIFDLYRIVGVFSTDVIEDDGSHAHIDRLLSQNEVHTANAAKLIEQQGKLIEMLEEERNK